MVRDNKRNTHAGASRRVDRRVNPHDIAVQIKERTTRVTPVNRGVGLDIINIGATIDLLAANGRNNAEGC